MKKFGLFLVSFCLAASLGGMPAMAKNQHAGKQHGKAFKHTETEAFSFEGEEGQKPLRFSRERSSSIRAYLFEEHRKNCPPGLAKKKNGCLPPGQAKKRYRIGDPLPPEHVMIPAAIITRLGPPPHGAYYAMVDDDVLLVSEATKKIVDAITLLSAVDK